MDTNQNPLDCDLNMMDTSLPLLKGGKLYDLKIAKVEIVKTVKTGADMLKLEMKNTESEETYPKDGNTETVAVGGCTVFDQVMLAPTGKATIQMVTQGVAELLQSLDTKLDSPKLSNVQQWYKQLEGKIARARVEYKGTETGADGKVYKPKNDVAYYAKR